MKGNALSVIAWVFGCLFIVAILSVFAVMIYTDNQQEARYGPYEVKEVTDANNILVKNGDGTIRAVMIGTSISDLDSSDKKEAKKYVKELIKDSEVYLEYDKEKSEYPLSPFGVYAYVYSKDGKMLNKLLLEEGLVEFEPNDGNDRYDSDFTRCEKTAKDGQLGIWENYTEENDE